VRTRVSLQTANMEWDVDIFRGDTTSNDFFRYPGGNNETAEFAHICTAQNAVHLPGLLPGEFATSEAIQDVPTPPTRQWVNPTATLRTTHALSRFQVRLCPSKNSSLSC
jgi:hypothetical protein